MSFENFYLMILLLLPFLFFAILVLTNKEGIERIFNKETIERLRVAGSGLSNRARNVLLLTSIFFMIIAVGHPYIEKGERDIEIGSLDIVMALDISGSMRCEDLYPNRLEFSKQKAKQLLDYLLEDNIMLLTFSDNDYLISPLTGDKETLKMVLDGITYDYLDGHSDFTALAKVLKKSLKEREDKIAIIISDGSNSEDLKRFKEIILDEEIKLYVILVGTPQGAPILDKNHKAILKNDQVILSRLNLELGKIAKQSGGDYIVADYGDSSIENIAKSIDANGGISNKKKRLHVNDRVELFYYPLLLALFLFFLALFSRPNGTIFKKLLKLRREK